MPALSLTAVALPLLLGLEWMDPNWLLDRFGPQFFYVSLVIVFVECGLLFPILPGDTLLFAVGLFVAGERIGVDLPTALLALGLAAFLGNVVGYEIGRSLGPAVHDRDGRFLKRKYLEQTSTFFDRHGNKALVIGRFIPIVRTFITVVAGVTEMSRRRFWLWSSIGAVLWVASITLAGYLLGETFPGLGKNIDYAIIVILVVSVLPIVYEWWKHRRQSLPR